MNNLHLRLTELERRQNNLITIGVIGSVDAGAARATVQIGELLTGPLPWLTTRAGQDVTWWVPTAGEQVVVLSPSGEPNQGVILPGLYCDAAPQPSSDPNKQVTTYQDGTTVTYDRAGHKLTIDLSGSTGTFLVQSGSSSIELTQTSIKLIADRIDLNEGA